MEIVVIIICAAAAYLLGSINTSILVGRLFGIGDIREHGSGNAGLTNTLRSVGKRAAALTLVGDVLKGVLAIGIAWLLCRLIQDETQRKAAVLAAGLCVVLGHNFPLYFGFKGGKGILTSATVIFMIDWRSGLIVTAVAVIFIILTRYVSLGSVLSAAAYPVCAALIYPGDVIYFIFALLLALLAILRHHANIKRLVNGTENKLGAKKKA